MLLFFKRAWSHEQLTAFSQVNNLIYSKLNTISDGCSWALRTIRIIHVYDHRRSCWVALRCAHYTDCCLVAHTNINEGRLNNKNSSLYDAIPVNSTTNYHPPEMIIRFNKHVFMITFITPVCPLCSGNEDFGYPSLFQILNQKMNLPLLVLVLSIVFVSCISWTVLFSFSILHIIAYEAQVLNIFFFFIWIKADQ